MSDDFALLLRLDQIRDGDRTDLTATAEQCAAIARRFDLGRINRLEAHAIIGRDGDKVSANGRLVAALEQSCVVTGEPIAAAIDEPFSLMFLPEPTGQASQADQTDTEVELGTEECDIIFYDGGTIDLGAAIADTLALSVDPFPRSASADAALKRSGILSEEEAGPFAGLAALRDALGGKAG